MTNDPSPAGPAHHRPASRSASGRSPQAHFEFLPAGGREPATVRAAGDIDLTNVGQFRAALDQAAAVSSTITADMTAVTYWGSRHHPAQKQRLGSRPHNERPGCPVLLRVSVHVG